MLFRRKQTPLCTHCIYSAEAEGGLRICRKRGLVQAEGSCRRFRYDPLQRTPKQAKAPDFSKYDKVDFSL